MNREILFRGKSIDTGEWVNGYLIKKIDPIYTDIETHCILHQERDNVGRLYPLTTWTRVDVETVGQFTGLTDKNGIKIFEGDICKYRNVFNKPHIGAVKYYANAKPVADNGHFVIDLAECNSEDFEVIGNIIDNPELLEGEENEV